MPVPSFDEIHEEFGFLGEWRDQCQYLIELGEELPDLDDEEKNDLNLVRGCQSRVWFVPKVDEDGHDPLIGIRAKSDAKIVDGLIVVLLSLANHKSAKTILDTNFQDAFTRLGLESHLVPQRRNGLHAMVRRLQSIAKVAVGITDTDDEEEGKDEGKDEGEGQGNRKEGSGASAASASPAAASPRTDFKQLKQQFPSLAKGKSPITYLDWASSAQKPQCVIDKETEVYEQYYANAYRGVYRYGDMVSRELEESREKLRQLIGAEHVDEVAFVPGATAGLNVIAQGWGGRHLKAGDEIVVSVLEHHANLVPWQWVAQQTGAKLKYIPLTSDGFWDLDRLDEAFSPRTKVLAVAAMTNVFGTIAPLPELIQRAKQTDALVVVDGAQSVPHLPTNVVEQGIDVLVFSGHKLYGPSGVGVLYGRREVLEETNPLLFGGHMIERVELETFEPAQLPAKFEAGTLPIAQAIALGTAVDWFQCVNVDSLHEHEMKLLKLATAKLSEIPGLKIHGPQRDKGAIVSFTMEGASAQDLASLLDLHGVCVRHGHHCTMPLHDWLGVPATVRASFGPANTEEDVHTLVEALHSARHQLKLA